MNVYDFDRTIYDGDCTVDFYFYCLKHFHKTRKLLPEVIWFGILYCFKIISKDEFKSRFFKFATLIPDIENVADKFWEENRHKIKDFYKKIKRHDDVIISASPQFVLNSICNTLSIKNLICTRVDMSTGKIIGKNCYGEEKVDRFKKAGFDVKGVDEFYSDSLSDSPLANISKRAYIVIKNDIIPWDKHK